MIELPVARPSNLWVRRERDRRWLRALAAMLITAAIVGAILFLIGWPRLQTTSINYNLIKLRAQVDELARRERALEVEVQTQMSPERLAARARALGLQPPPAAQVSVMRAEGTAR